MIRAPCAVSQPSVPPSLPPGAGLRTSRPRRGLVKETPPGRVSSVQHLLYLRKPSGSEGASPPCSPGPHTALERELRSSGEFHRARGRGTGQLCSEAVQQRQNHPKSSPAIAQRWGQGFAASPLAFPRPPQVLPWPHLPAPGMELSAIPDGRAGLGSPHPSESQHGCSPARHICPLLWAKLWPRDR